MRGATANREAIQAARVQQGLTQEQLARLADIDVRTVRKAEQGKRLDIGTLTRLAFALNTELRLLVVDELSDRELQILRRDVALRWQRACDKQNLESLLSCYHDDATLRLPGGPQIPIGGVFRGKTEIARVQSATWKSYEAQPVPMKEFTLVVGDDTVVVSGNRGVCLPNKGVAYLSCVHLFRFRGELISDHQVEFDTLEFARLLQLPPVSGER